LVSQCETVCHLLCATVASC